MKTAKGQKGKHAPRRTEGYTLIEVMMAVGIMTVGAVGIMSLQQATTRGNSFARQITSANHITRTWVERLRTDALAWNEPGAAGVAGTTYLSTIPAATTTIGPWTAMGSAGGVGDSYAFDFLGERTDGAPPDAPIHFCTNVRLRWVLGNNAIRADVRTWWHRESRNVTARFACAPGSEDAVTTELAEADPDLHAVYGSILLRPTPVSNP